MNLRVSKIGLLVRTGKAVLVGFVALWLGLVAWGNLVDYASNWQFVHHVLSMDTIWSAELRAARGITAEPVQRVAYAFIIAVELLSALLCAIGAVQLILVVRDPLRFRARRELASLGLIVGMLLFGVGFLAIGGEWFAMWQSKQWNGQDTATRFFLVIATVQLILQQDEAGYPASGGDR